MSVRLLSASLVSIGIALAMHSLDARAQSAGRELVTYPPQGLQAGSPPQVMSLPFRELPCGWNFWWDPPEGYAELRTGIQLLNSSASSFYSFGNGLAGTGYMETTLNATYLPSTDFLCGSQGTYWPWEWVQLTWNNPDCNNHPLLQYAPHPTTGYANSEELTNTSVALANYIEDARWYWGDVGNELNYSALHTYVGGDVVFYPDNGLPVTWIGLYHPETRTIEMNWSNYWWILNGDQWSFATAHELGHAIGFGHSFADTNYTIMYDEAGYSAGLGWVRDLDKCGATAAFPVPIQMS